MVAIISSPLSAPADSPAAARAARTALSRKEALYDASLVRRFNTGDQSAFVEIVMRYREKMLVIAHSMLRNHADAEEIAQDTFIRAHRSLALFRGESSLSACRPAETDHMIEEPTYVRRRFVSHCQGQNVRAWRQ